MQRRTFLRAGGAAALSGALATRLVHAPSLGATSVSVPDTGTHVVLLGTSGGPVPFPGRTGISTAVVVDGATYLIDLGHGAFDQIVKANIDPGSIRAAFLTHLHSDHTADLWTLPWLRFGGVDPLTQKLHIYGPGSAGSLPQARSGHPPVVNASNPVPGTAELIAHSLAASAYDVNIRMRDEGWPDVRTMYAVHEIVLPHVGASARGPFAPAMKPFEVMHDDLVTVTAILVEHPPVFPSYAFRFDTAHGSVTLSGDTTVTDNLVTLARGSDLLVHEAIDLQVVQQQTDLSAAQVAHLEEAHTDVLKVGGVAQSAGVRRLALTHLSPGSLELPDASWQLKAQTGYTGQVIVGDDLRVIEVG